MAKLKRLVNLTDDAVIVKEPITQEEIKSRANDYLELTPLAFGRKYRHSLFRPVEIEIRGENYAIQMNACTEPYCKWYGQPQIRFDKIKNKPYRYKLGSNNEQKRFDCNPDPYNSFGAVLGCYTAALSNWSIAEEIKRLYITSHTTPMEPEYVFHKETCEIQESNPFDNPKSFYARGKSSSNSKKWQCKICKKITNVLPSQRECYTYHQKRNEILPRFARLLLSRTPVKNTCEYLKMGSETYYNKLEWLYKRCLEFLERYETKAFETQTFDTIWMETDQLIYNLNNVRRRGQGGVRYAESDEPVFPTNVVISAESRSKYVFRADVAFDWHTSLNSIEQDTLKLKDDHIYNFARKNERLRHYSYCPQSPTKNDTQSEYEYLQESSQFWQRDRYTKGIHVNSTYTAIAHHWLIKHMVHVNNWRFVSDEDNSIMTSIFRVFAKEVWIGDSHYFLSKIDRSKRLKQAYTESVKARQTLLWWAQSNGYTSTNLYYIAKKKLIDDIEGHRFYVEIEKDGRMVRKWAKNPIDHPLPPIDKGFYTVDCLTDVSGYTTEDLAKMLLSVNTKATDVFMQTMRRSISILERPLVTARTDGKSYIYSNYNPKYAQYAITILRTFYNFCWTQKRGGKRETPAQRLGITDKQFSIEDIIYLR